MIGSLSTSTPSQSKTISSIPPHFTAVPSIHGPISTGPAGGAVELAGATPERGSGQPDQFASRTRPKWKGSLLRQSGLQGSLARLPRSGDVWPEAERKLWLLLEGGFKLIYKYPPTNEGEDRP